MGFKSLRDLVGSVGVSFALLSQFSNFGGVSLGNIEREGFEVEPITWYDFNKDGVEDAIVAFPFDNFGSVRIGYIDGNEIHNKHLSVKGNMCFNAELLRFNGLSGIIKNWECYFLNEKSFSDRAFVSEVNADFMSKLEPELEIWRLYRPPIRGPLIESNRLLLRLKLKETPYSLSLPVVNPYLP